jgi:hypothetical protein
MRLKIRILILIVFFAVANAQVDIDVAYEDYDALLNKYVHHKDVKYAKLLSEKSKLDEFINVLGTISPDSHPDQFPSRNEKLAYWINAYNASILKLILDNYPVKSIKSINLIGVTVWWKKTRLGGEKISFKALEDKIIRDRFRDPRIHFAINCASKSCPPLLNEAFLPGSLENQLNERTHTFINDSSNFYIDKKNRMIYMSSIFDWYKNDFLEWLKKDKEFSNPTLIDYITLYFDGIIPSEISTYDIVYSDYDWNLNDFH